jgi:hypothetical protein
MKKTLALLAAAALASACAKQDIDPDDVRATLPKAAAVQIQTPSSSNPNALSAPTVGTVSEFAVASWWTALTFNLSTAWTLTVIQFITTFPPAECGPDSCTWGPWTGEHQTVWKLDVTRSGDGYGYVLAAHAAGATEFLSIVSGTAFKGSQPGRGNGEFTVSFENGRTVDPTKDDHGVLDVSYDNRTSLQIGATFLGARNDDPENPDSNYIDIAYQFGASATGGELQVAFQTVDGPEKNLSLRTRWVEGGPGRGDAQYTEGTTNFEASQCWPGLAGGAAAWVTAYERVTDGVTVITVGSVDSCGSFSEPLFSNLVLP